jgi:hypothetical protein
MKENVDKCRRYLEENPKYSHNIQGEPKEPRKEHQISRRKNLQFNPISDKKKSKFYQSKIIVKTESRAVKKINRSNFQFGCESVLGV